MTHVTCRLTAKNRDQLRNPTLGNRVWATFLFIQRVKCWHLCCSLLSKFIRVLVWYLSLHTLAPPGDLHFSVYMNRLNAGNNRGVQNVPLYRAIDQTFLLQFVIVSTIDIVNARRFWPTHSAVSYRIHSRTIVNMSLSNTNLGPIFRTS